MHHDAGELEQQLLKAAIAPYQGAPLPQLGPTLAQAYAIQRKMGIDDDAASELADLEMETRPEDVLAEIERLQQRAFISGVP